MSTEILIINPRALNPWGKDAATGTQVISETIRKKNNNSTRPTRSQPTREPTHGEPKLDSGKNAVKPAVIGNQN